MMGACISIDFNDNLQPPTYTPQQTVYITALKPPQPATVLTTTTSPINPIYTVQLKDQSIHQFTEDMLTDVNPRDSMNCIPPTECSPLHTLLSYFFCSIVYTTLLSELDTRRILLYDCEYNLYLRSIPYMTLLPSYFVVYLQLPIQRNYAGSCVIYLVQ